MALLINGSPKPGHKTIGSVMDKMAAIDVANYITAMIIKIKKGAIDLRTACVLAHAETAFQPASQAMQSLVFESQVLEGQECQPFAGSSELSGQGFFVCAVCKLSLKLEAAV
eukprot:893577-Pyramimonas_sp.AAC.1